MSEQPEQWARLEVVADLLGRTGNGDMAEWVREAQRAFAEREAELVAENAKLREALEWYGDTGHRSTHTPKDRP